MTSGLRPISSTAPAVNGVNCRWYSPRAGSVNSGPLRSAGRADQERARARNEPTLGLSGPAGDDQVRFGRSGVSDMPTANHLKARPLPLPGRRP